MNPNMMKTCLENILIHNKKYILVIKLKAINKEAAKNDRTRPILTINFLPILP